MGKRGELGSAANHSLRQLTEECCHSIHCPVPKGDEQVGPCSEDKELFQLVVPLQSTSSDMLCQVGSHFLIYTYRLREINSMSTTTGSS